MTSTESLISLLDASEALPAATALRARSYDALHLQPGARVADVGCGTGLAVAELSERGANATGVDPAEAMLVAARERRPGLDFAAGTAEALPFADGELDGYRADKVYHVLADPAAALAEAWRVLRPGGRIVLMGQDWEGIMVDSDDPELARELVLNRAAALANPRAARGYRNSLLDNGFDGVTVEGGLAVFTDAAMLPIVANLVRDEAGDPDRIAAWLDEQKRRADEGRLMLAMPMFVAAGTRP